MFLSIDNLRGGGGDDMMMFFDPNGNRFLAIENGNFFEE
jgi:hypothetical protein